MKAFKRVVLILIFAVVVAALTIAGINMYVIQSTQENIISVEEALKTEADCIIVLGAAVRPDHTPSLMLRDRLDKSVYIYDNGETDIILMSGDNGKIEYNEVDVMKDYAIESGVPENNIYLDHAGFSTYESMYRLRDVFVAKKAIVITQEYHLYRALYTGEKLGLDVVGVAADTREYKGQRDREIREIMARVKDFFYVMIDKQPTYLGDPIELVVKE